MQLSDAIAEFLSARRSEGIRPNTLKNYTRDLRRLMRHIGDLPEVKGKWQGGAVVGGLSATHIDEAIAAMHDEGLSNGTINIFHTTVRAFCKWARSRGVILPDQDPTAGRRWLREPPKPRKRLSVAQTRALLELDQHPRDKMLVAVGIFLLLRQSEAASLRISDVDLETNRIRVTIHKSKDVDLMVIPVELRPILREWLTFYAAEAGPLQPNWYLIPAKVGHRFDGDTARDRLKPTAKMSRVADIVKASLTKIGFPVKDENGHSTWEGMHTLRRSSALNLYHEEVDRGVDQALMTAKSWLHHSSVTMTERYLGLESGRETRNRDFEDRPMFPSLAAEEKLTNLRDHRAM